MDPSLLRKEFDIPDPSLSRAQRIRHLGAFWPHWHLHKRKCDATGREIISIFRPECPYPVWHKDEWAKNAKPPQGTFDFEKPFFPQAEILFKQCPIAHNSGIGSENSEYTDDWWFGKNCYLSHSGVNCENSRYVYRILRGKDLLYCVFSYDVEQCFDVINCEKCQRCIYGLYCKYCHDTAFCYDCRNCHDCILCFNLRNKQYCIGNQQYSPEEYAIKKEQFRYDTLTGYEYCKTLFQKMMREMAWHRALSSDFVERVTDSNYVLRIKNSSNVFFGFELEDSDNVTRLGWAKTSIDSINLQDAERAVFSSGVQIKCYEVLFSHNVDNVRFVTYSQYSSRCENIFGCCGLVGGKNCIFNAPYSVEEYSSLKKKIIDHMKSSGEWGQFFPGSFAPNPYDESWSSFYFPLSEQEQKQQGYFYLPNPEKRETAHVDISTLPKTAHEAGESTMKNVYWDEMAEKPFQILPQDINFCRDLEVPLPHSHYIRRIQENFRWMPYNGTLRTTKCAKSGNEIQTSWPSEYDGRILSEDEYLKVIG